MKVDDKVYVFNWGQRYSEFRKWNNDSKCRELVFPWKTKLPQYIKESDDTIVYTPKLTQKGLPFKDGSKIEVSRKQSHKSYEYTIREIITHPNNSEIKIALISSNHTEHESIKVWAQIDIKALTALSTKEQESLKHLQQETYLQALAKNNLGKWENNYKIRAEFPKELLLTLYGENQNVLFGSSMTKGIVTYNIVPKEYTVNNVAIFLSSNILYNGEGIDLSDKPTITWAKLKTICVGQNFEN